MHVFLVCALLTVNQKAATCWEIRNSPEASCTPYLVLWLEEATIWHSRNRDAPVFAPAVSCGENVAPPAGAVLLPPSIGPDPFAQYLFPEGSDPNAINQVRAAQIAVARNPRNSSRAARHTSAKRPRAARRDP